ncbi:MAG TPA: NAD(P)-dependent oxidoreductase [Actinomycetota bacterium]|nr:NAD(P)-dependent oxidoreductase [Actinomycetota bacterium]
MTDMQSHNLQSHKLGWIGTGRMGFNLAARLIDAGCDVAIYNRTRSKAEPLARRGGKLVDSPRELADRDIVFSMVAGDDDFRAVTTGEEGVLVQAGAAPQILIDSTTISAGVSAEVRAAAEAVGTRLLAAPVSGNPNVVRAGKLTLVVSGPEEAWDVAQPYLQVLGAGATYVGEGDAARLAKICHNLMLGVVAQSMAEITVLAEKGGLKRAAFLEFLNNSVMGSPFTRYKTPAFVNLDYHATFTPVLLRKDFDLGLKAARELGVPMPLSALVHEIVQTMIGHGWVDDDFAKLLELQARASGLELQSEGADVSDGLEPQA